jgi:hypothetical protein
MFDNVNLLNSSDITAQESSPAAAAHDEMLATYARFYWGLAFEKKHPEEGACAGNPQPGDDLSGGNRETDQAIKRI